MNKYMEVSSYVQVPTALPPGKEPPPPFHLYHCIKEAKGGPTAYLDMVTKRGVPAGNRTQVVHHPVASHYTMVMFSLLSVPFHENLQAACRFSYLGATR